MLRHGLISPQSEMQEEREKLKKELLSKKESEFEELKNFHSVYCKKS